MFPNILDKELAAVRATHEEFVVLEERVKRWAQEERERGNKVQAQKYEKFSEYCAQQIELCDQRLTMLKDAIKLSKLPL